MAWPYLIHGDYILADGGDKMVICKHKPDEYYYPRSPESRRAVHNNTCCREVVVSKIKGHIRGTFAYIKTEEALSVHRHW
jgi:hypothetical protein